MKKFIAAAVAVSAATLVASPASATIVIVDASSIQGDNVLFNAGVQTNTVVTGSTQRGTSVNFRGTTTTSNVIRANGGQARVEGDLNTITSNPNDTLGLTSLNFSLTSGTFNNLEFNLFGADGGGRAFFTAIDNMGEVFTFSPDGYALGTGSNFFGFQGINGESIASFAIRIAPGSIQDVRQIRLDEVVAAPVPEPATWAMMLVGFAGVGVAMRRRRSGKALFRQVA